MNKKQKASKKPGPTEVTILLDILARKLISRLTVVNDDGPIEFPISGNMLNLSQAMSEIPSFKKD